MHVEMSGLRDGGKVFIAPSLILLLALFSLAAAGSSVTLQAAESENLDDGMAVQNYPATEYGSYNQMNVGSPGSTAERQSYVKFSLASLPQGSTVTNSSLQLYYSYDGLETDDKLMVSAYYVLPAYSVAGQEWAEGSGSSGDACTGNELCWSTRPVGEQISNTPESSLLFDKSQGAFSGWYSWPVTQTLQQAANTGSGSVTISLRSSWVGGSLAISDFLGFRTKEYWDSRFRPRLVVEYETGPVNDIAVTSISTPSSAVRGAIVPIGVTVKNEGNQVENFTVVVNDATDGVLIGTTDVISLNGGGSSAFSYSWDTSVASLGSHVIEASAGIVAGESDTADNVKNTVITINIPDTIPPVISNVQAGSITDRSAAITWATDEGSVSLVRYGTSVPPVTEVSSAILATAHSVNLTGLSAETTYYFEVQSADSSGNAAKDDNGGQYYSFATLTAPVVTVPGCENAPFRPAGQYYYSTIFNYDQVGWYSGRDLNHDNAAFATPFPLCQRTHITSFNLDILASSSPSCEIDIGVYSDGLDVGGNHYPVSLLWSGRVPGNVNGTVEAALDMWLDAGVYHVVWATAAATGCPLPPGVHGTPYPPYINSINANGKNEMFASYGGAGLWQTWPYQPWRFGNGAYYLRLFYAP